MWETFSIVFFIFFFLNPEYWCQILKITIKLLVYHKKTTTLCHVTHQWRKMIRNYDCLIQLVDLRSDSIWNVFTNTIVWRASEITGRKGGFSLPVLLFVDIYFIFWEASQAYLLPPQECVRVPPRKTWMRFFLNNFVFLAFVALNNHHGDPSVMQGFFKICGWLLRSLFGCWHRQMGIAVTAFVSGSNDFFFFFLLMMSDWYVELTFQTPLDFWITVVVLPFEELAKELKKNYISSHFWWNHQMTESLLDYCSFLGGKFRICNTRCIVRR